MSDVLSTSSLSTSSSSTSSVNVPTSNDSSRRSSISSSKPEFRPVHTEIIRRNLVKEFLSFCSFKEKKPMSKYIRRKLEPTLSVAEIGFIMEQEDEIEKKVTDMIDEKSRRNEKKKANETEMLFNIDL